ncbi:MAG: gliding motility-associated ABC transporter substrate-binding protein GldG [Flavobacteriaceae bacterium]|nr:gliding motility-associated ABC transporter substrate-binding protein GldG [Flavobacteriaceae bacterium]
MGFKNIITKALIAIVATIAINYISSKAYSRLDITQDKRYTLSEASKKTIATAEEPIYIDVFLTGDMPSEFKRLQTEVKTLLDEFTEVNDYIIISYVNPKEENPDINVLTTEMEKFGMPPLRVDVQENGKTSQEVIFPWAVINYNKKIEKVSLIKTNSNNSIDRINNSVQHLEYAFASAFKRITGKKEKKIGLLLGNDELESKYVYDFLSSLESSYHIIPFDLDSVNTKPVQTLKNLEQLDLIIAAKPQKAFTDKQKYALDQYTINGGKSLWLIDNVHVELDSISQHGETLALGRDLNLTDLFFQYGFRVNPVLVKDAYSANILILDKNNQPNQTPWFYNPVVIPKIRHSIVNNINPVRFEFANTIDLLKQGINIKKTPLLQSSEYSATVGMPIIISTKEIELFKQKDIVKSLTKKNLTLAALLEGNFTSAYKHRVKPFEYDNHKDEHISSKMIVIADGDVIKNQFSKGKPLPLGFDRNTNQTFGNKEFLLNAVNYLLDDTGLMNVRNKEVKIPFLDVERISNEKQKWQLINIILPLLLLVVFGFLFNYFRKRKYS